MVIQLASDPRVSGLAGDWIAEIHPNVCAWIERDEASFRKAKSEQRRQLQIADVSFCRIAREADVVPCIRLKIASGTNFGQPIPEPRVSPPVGAMRREPKPAAQRLSNL